MTKFATPDSVDHQLRQFELRIDALERQLNAQFKVYDLVMFFPGLQNDGALLARLEIDRQVQFPQHFVGSQASSVVAATAETVFTIARIRGFDNETIGTVTFPANATEGIFTANLPITFFANDIITITNQATADDTLEDISVSLKGQR